MYTEGKSNYFKGSILLLSYLVVVIGFYFSGYGNEMDLTRHGLGMSRFDVLGDDGQWMSYSRGPEGFKTVGRRTSGQAF
jgi:Ca2+:H+ antiporter